ncbi:MAG: hypothetical protein C0519_11270 [Hyphomicrobium sp.]|nr:hypothetical protein [Hyphomicrobium sp.]
MKYAFQEGGISMPDEAREVIFPHGVPVTMLAGKQELTPRSRPVKSPFRLPAKEVDTPSTRAEGGLASDADMIKEQARNSQPLNLGENLLEASSSSSSAANARTKHGDHREEPSA